MTEDDRPRLGEHAESGDYAVPVVQPAAPPPQPGIEPLESAPLVRESAGEDVARGIIFALPIIPAAVVAWGLLWSFGFVASIVSYGVAAGAVWLYSRGTGGRVTRRGVPWVIGLIVITVVLCIFSGMAVDLASQWGSSLLAAFTDGDYWYTLWLNIFQNARLWGDYALPIALAVAFAALGCWRTIARLLRTSRGA
jgi:hypothetical protein